MNFNTLEVKKDGATLYITINRPKVLNALNAEVLSDLDAAMEILSTDESLKGCILTGSGEKAFVAGADIAEINSISSQEEGLKMSQRGQGILEKIESSGKPVIAAVNGFALGGGCEIAMACHMRIASENARFGQPEVNLGLIAGYGGTQRLTRLIGRSKATELLLTADMIKAPEALALGLVNHVVPQEELIAKCEGILKKIYTKSPLAVAYTLDAIHHGANHPSGGYAEEAKLFGMASSSYDGNEGTAAFLEKRDAKFEGR